MTHLNINLSLGLAFKYVYNMTAGKGKKPGAKQTEVLGKQVYRGFWLWGGQPKENFQKT